MLSDNVKGADKSGGKPGSEGNEVCISVCMCVSSVFVQSLLKGSVRECTTDVRCLLACMTVFVFLCFYVCDQQ